MSFGQPCDEFPLSSLPPLIRDALLKLSKSRRLPWGLWQHLPWALFHLSARI